MRFENKALYIERTDTEKTIENFAAVFRCLLQQNVVETDESVPKWVKTVVNHLNENIFKYLKDAASESDYRIPYKAGYMCGIMRWLVDYMERQKEILDKKFETLHLPCRIINECTDEETSKIWDSAFSKVCLDDADENNEEMTKTYLRLIRNAYLRISVQEAAEFYQGVADGLRGLDQRGSIYGMARLNTPIMIDLWLFWPAITQMRSVNELYRCLCKLEGDRKIGEYKRVEKICERIGLTFRKPGRPKKLKKSGNTDTASKA